MKIEECKVVYQKIIDNNPCETCISYAMCRTKLLSHDYLLCDVLLNYCNEWVADDVPKEQTYELKESLSQIFKVPDKESIQIVLTTRFFEEDTKKNRTFLSSIVLKRYPTKKEFLMRGLRT